MSKKVINTNKIFSQRLDIEMKKRNIGVVELAKNLGITRQAITNYLKCESIPNANVISKISVLFNVSTDYLLGLTSYPFYSDIQIDMLKIYEMIGLNYNSVMKLRKLQEKSYEDIEVEILLRTLNKIIMSA